MTGLNLTHLYINNCTCTNLPETLIFLETNRKVKIPTSIKKLKCSHIKINTKKYHQIEYLNATNCKIKYINRSIKNIHLFNCIVNFEDNYDFKKIRLDFRPSFKISENITTLGIGNFVGDLSHFHHLRSGIFLRCNISKFPPSLKKLTIINSIIEDDITYLINAITYLENNDG